MKTPAFKAGASKRLPGKTVRRGDRINSIHLTPPGAILLKNCEQNKAESRKSYQIKDRDFFGIRGAGGSVNDQSPIDRLDPKRDGKKKKKTVSGALPKTEKRGPPPGSSSRSRRI